MSAICTHWRMTKQIAHLREALKLSRTEFGKELGVVRTTVMRWEQGKITPPKYIEAALRDLAERKGLTWPPEELKRGPETRSAA